MIENRTRGQPLRTLSTGLRRTARSFDHTDTVHIQPALLYEPSEHLSQPFVIKRVRRV